jgi:hypothetical protein
VAALIVADQPQCAGESDDEAIPAVETAAELVDQRRGHRPGTAPQISQTAARALDPCRIVSHSATAIM